jgi:3-methyladenine DNA glycosylase Tag
MNSIEEVLIKQIQENAKAIGELKTEIAELREYIGDNSTEQQLLVHRLDITKLVHNVKTLQNLKLVKLENKIKSTIKELKASVEVLLAKEKKRN